MPTVAPLDAEQRRTLLPELSGWTVLTDRDALRRVFEFQDFNAAWGFMCRVALVAEQMNHHPEWRNVWNRVEVELTTHDAGGLSMLDIAFARRIDALAGG